MPASTGSGSSRRAPRGFRTGACPARSCPDLTGTALPPMRLGVVLFARGTAGHRRCPSSAAADPAPFWTRDGGFVGLDNFMSLLRPSPAWLFDLALEFREPVGHRRTVIVMALRVSSTPMRSPAHVLPLPLAASRADLADLPMLRALAAARRSALVYLFGNQGLLQALECSGESPIYGFDWHRHRPASSIAFPHATLILGDGARPPATPRHYEAARCAEGRPPSSACSSPSRCRPARNMA